MKLPWVVVVSMHSVGGDALDKQEHLFPFRGQHVLSPYFLLSP